MNQKINELEINGEKYVLKSSVSEAAPSVDGLPLVLVRGYGSGVQYGYLKASEGCQVTLVNSRRIWNWNKATETNQIAVDGIDAANSKVTVVTPEKTIHDVIETINITSKAAENLLNQPVWKK